MQHLSLSFVFFSWVTKDDDESKGSSLSCVFFLSCRRWWQAFWLIVILWFFFLGCKRWQQAEMHVVVLCWFSLACRTQQEARRLIFVFFLQLQKTMMNLLGCCHLLCFFLVAKDNNKPRASLSFLGFFPYKKWQWVGKLVVVFYVFFLNCRKQWRARMIVVVVLIFLELHKMMISLSTHHCLMLGFLEL